MSGTAEWSTAIVALVPPTLGFHPAIVPSSVANRNKALPVLPVLASVTKKSEGVVLKTVPVGVPPVGASGAGMATMSGTAVPSPRYRVETPALLSDTQIGLVGLDESPHGLTRFLSVNFASPRVSDTRLVW